MPFDWRVGLAVLSFLSLGLGAESYAAAPSRDASLKILTDAIASQSSDETILQTTAAGLRSANPGFCQKVLVPQGDKQFPVPTCLRAALTDVLNYAYKRAVFDPVEVAILRHKVNRISAFDGTKLTWDASLEAEPGGSGAPLPVSMIVYRGNKAEFAAHRKSLNVDPNLYNPAVPPAMGDPKLTYAGIVAEIYKAYPRKVKGVGHVGAEQFFASQMGMFNLNLLADLMRTASKRIEESSAKIMQFPANYTMDTSLDQQSETQRLALSAQFRTLAPTDPAYEATRKKLASLNDLHTQFQKKIKVDALLAQRMMLISTRENELEEQGQPDIAGQPPVDRKTLGDEIAALGDQITGVESKLSDLTYSATLPPPSVMNLAINDLRIQFAQLITEPPYNTMNLEIGDVVMSGWVSGDISTEYMHYLLSTAGLTESHPSFLKKSLGFAQAVGQAGLIYVPVVGQISAVALQIVLTAVQENKTSDRKGSDAVQLIRVNQN